MKIRSSSLLFALTLHSFASIIRVSHAFTSSFPSLRTITTTTSKSDPTTKTIMKSTSNDNESTTTPPSIQKRKISSPQILSQHDTFLLDMWGVMHDGVKAYEGVLETVSELKAAGKKLIILSNSSKRRDNSEKMLKKLGFNPNDFENIITSGDISHTLLQNKAHQLGCSNWEPISNLIEKNQRKVFVFGSGDNDESYCISAGWELSSIQEADLIVARGTFTINNGSTVVSKTENEDEYWKVMEDAMTIASARKVPMLVTNPDKVRPDASRNPMPGSIGDTYERFLWCSHCPPYGEMTEEGARMYVKRIGKPFREVYDIALNGSDASRAIMVGDALETDVTGGNAVGCSTLWVVKNGIHNVEVEERGEQMVIDGFNLNSYATYAFGKEVRPSFVAEYFQCMLGNAEKPLSARNIMTTESPTSNDNMKLDSVISATSFGSRVSRRDMTKHEINFLNDDPSTMTYARRAALYLMRRYSWYNPQLLEQQQQKLFVETEGDEIAISSASYIEMDEMSSDGSFNRSMLQSPIRQEQPSLEKAWAYFERVTLPRYLDHKSAILTGSCSANYDRVSPPEQSSTYNCSHYNDNSQEEVMDLAEPGEDSYPTKLYSPFWTPMNQMGDFGVGVGLYFSALRSIMILTFIAGIINIPNMVYFASDKYSQGQEGVHLLIKGSAVCTVKQYVPCPTCELEDFADVPHRIATANSVYSDGDLIFVMKNYCDGAKLPLAFVNYVTLLCIMYGLWRIGRHSKAQEVKFDEDEQTAQDYSIVIKNPPPDATNPDEWKTFFDTNFGPDIHVTCCTVARDNYQLVQALVARRVILQKLKWKLPAGNRLDIGSLAINAHDIRERRGLFDRLKSLVVPDVPELFKELVNINNEVRKLSMMDFPATRVFITFETERAQRTVLHHLSVGSRSIMKFSELNITKPTHAFRSNIVLHVKEAPEPSTIRWHDLSDRPWERGIRFLLTSYAWLCALVLVIMFIRLCHMRSAKFAAYAIAICNGVFPEFARLLVNFESHPSEERLQTSLYVKIAAFRFINTAIIVNLVTPFPSTLGSGTDDLVDGVKDIFVAEIVTSSIIKFMDPGGLFKRHYLAPRAKSQEEMNSYMRGEVWYLAERFTNMSKRKCIPAIEHPLILYLTLQYFTPVFFLTLWYSSIYPFGFFMCAVALLINMFADRFSLMRTWGRAPSLGPSISHFSRRYFFGVAISAMAISSSYSWAGFPYDNLCLNDINETDDDSNGYYTGSWDVTSIDGSRNASVTVSEGDPSYKYCKQSLYWYGKGFNFPAIPYWQTEGEEWMTNEQELLTRIFGWSSFALVVATLSWILIISVQTMLFRSNYEACGDDQGIPFSEVPVISSYIPEVRSDLFSYPLLAVDTDDVDEELYEWKDAERPYSYYDLSRDAQTVLNGAKSKDEIKTLFSSVTYWKANETSNMKSLPSLAFD